MMALPRKRSSALSEAYQTLLRPEILGETIRELGARVSEGEIGSALYRFSKTTTAHGIPRACSAEKRRGRFFWSAIVVFCAVAFAYQFFLVCSKYNRREKIVNVQLVFDTAPFPAVTVCNLNPFKKHLAQTVPEISSTLSTFYQAVSYSKDAIAKQQDIQRSRRSSSEDGPINRLAYVQNEPVLSDCSCASSDLQRECIQYNSAPLSNSSLCICSYDKQDSSAWPCFSAAAWHQDVCPECNDIGYCILPRTNGTDVDDKIDCLCNNGDNNINYCLVKPERVKRMWEIHGSLPDKASPFRQEAMERLAELGYANMTDEVAITVKTKESLVLTMAGLPRQQRIALSYGKAEFIRMCSFNGQQCDIVEDFKLHVDSTFGNCYIFNAKKSEPLVSSRAGPSYGLRLMVFVNASDYLPTTEATGVRIAIHDRNGHPFPDTFGYSAPTGFVSSFGLSLRKVNRLSVPDADCLPPETPTQDSYIFRGYKYEPEGCIRSCYQNLIVQECNCADPRFPAPNGTTACDVFKESARTCLSDHSDRFTTHDPSCKCTHPCAQNVFSTTYSAARWPSGSFQVGDCDRDHDKCMAHYTQNAAMLEIYYEQMSFEVLTESEAYLLVNLVSDFGGQLGLWMGFSVITMFEVLVLLMDLVTLYCRKQKIEREEKKDKKRLIAQLSHQEGSPQNYPDKEVHSNYNTRSISKIENECNNNRRDSDVCNNNGSPNY